MTATSRTIWYTWSLSLKQNIQVIADGCSSLCCGFQKAAITFVHADERALGLHLIRFQEVCAGSSWWKSVPVALVSVYELRIPTRSSLRHNVAEVILGITDYDNFSEESIIFWCFVLFRLLSRPVSIYFPTICATTCTSYPKHSQSSTPVARYILTCYLFSPHHLMFLNFPLLHQMLVNTSAWFHLVHSAGRWVTWRKEPSSSLPSDGNRDAAVFQSVGHHTSLQVIKTLGSHGTL